MAAVGISVYHRIYSTKVWVRQPNKGMEAPPIMAFYFLTLSSQRPGNADCSAITDVPLVIRIKISMIQ
jgi:hypothetical protein